LASTGKGSPATHFEGNGQEQAQNWVVGTGSPFADVCGQQLVAYARPTTSD
jgi:hypothetical protein